jgi:hypothetical protein
MKKLNVVAALILVSVFFAGCESFVVQQVTREEIDHNAEMLYWNNSPFISVPQVKDFDTLGIVTVVKTVESFSARNGRNIYHDNPITYAEIMAEVVKAGGDAAVNIVVDREITTTYEVSTSRTVWVEKFTATALAIKYTQTLHDGTVTTDENGVTTTTSVIRIAPVGSPERRP